MTVEIISWSISTKVWDRVGIELATPGIAVRHASVARHVTDCATRPGLVTIDVQISFPASYLNLHAKYSHMPNMPLGCTSPDFPYILYISTYAIAAYTVWILWICKWSLVKFHSMRIRDSASTSLLVFKVIKLAKIKNRYNQVPHLTKDTTWESDKNTIKHHKRE